MRLASQFAIAGLAGPPKPVIPEARAGVAAAVRIGRDLDGGLGARTLSGAVAKVTVNGKIPGNRRKLFPEFAHLISWTDRWDSGPGWSFASLPSREYEPGIFHYGFGGDAVDPITGSSGAIRTAFVEVKRPSYVLRSWNWVTRPAGPKTPREEWPAVLPRDTLLSVMLDESTDSDGRPWTTVRLEHDDLPVEWVDDMAAWWELQIALVGQTGPGVA